MNVYVRFYKGNNWLIRRFVENGTPFYRLYENGNYLGNSDTDTALINVINDIIKFFVNA